MIAPNPFIGTGFHALGGASAACCYLPYHRTRQWSWGTFWLVQALFAWLLMPALIGIITVPDFSHILQTAPRQVVWSAFLLGAVYGFGGMSFGFAIRNIGYSLTYSIAIGLSAVLGTLTPIMMDGRMAEYFSRPGSGIVLIGMLLAVIGVACCGWAGFLKEQGIRQSGSSDNLFNMKKGLALAIVAGLLSAVFNVSLEVGQPISDMAAEAGAGHFEGNAKMIVSTSGCLVVNMVWFIVLGIKNSTHVEFVAASGIGLKRRMKNTLWSALAGSMWCFQFFFYGVGHVRMGNFQFISWVLHMAMLIFFSYVVGVVMKEWKNVSGKTYRILLIALLTIIASALVITLGSYYGEQRM
jgi:L-rhamnose-H+ transport protein